MLFSDLPPLFVRVFGVVLGLLWGSFLNVVIYRVPRGMSVVHPPSHCPACGKNVAPWLNVPVFSYLILRGKARCCGAKMSARYPLVEALGGGLSLAIIEVLLLGLPPRTTLATGLLLFGAYLALALGLLAAAFIDLEHMILPDEITLGGAVLGVATAGLRGMPYGTSLLGAVVGYLVVWFPFVFLYKKVRGQDGMGLGDAKLLMLAGAWFGILGAVVVLFAGAIQGSVAGIVMMLTQGKIEEPEAVALEREELIKDAEAGDEEAKKILEEDPLAKAPEEGFLRARLPFGPFLIVSIYEFLFLGDRIVSFIGLDVLFAG